MVELASEWGCVVDKKKEASTIPISVQAIGLNRRKNLELHRDAIDLHEGERVGLRRWKEERSFHRSDFSPSYQTEEAEKHGEKLSQFGKASHVLSWSCVLSVWFVCLQRWRKERRWETDT